MELEDWIITYTNLTNEVNIIRAKSYEEMWSTLYRLYNKGFTKVTAEKLN